MGRSMKRWFDTPFEHPWLPIVADYFQRLSEFAGSLLQGMGATGWRRGALMQCPAGLWHRWTRPRAAVVSAD
jgi:hypothetical protein